MAAKQLIALMVAGLLALPAFAENDVLGEALRMPPYDLAQSYLDAKKMSTMLELARRGATIHWGNTTINKNNVEHHAQALEQVIPVIEQAIRQRGFQDISGSYNAAATKSCEKAGAPWMAFVEENLATRIEVTQTGFVGELAGIAEFKGEKLPFANQFAVSQTSIALVDEMNSDYWVEGSIKDGVIVFVPDLSNLEVWPAWANPPKRKHLERCKVTLKLLP